MSDTNEDTTIGLAQHTHPDLDEYAGSDYAEGDEVDPFVVVKPRLPGSRYHLPWRGLPAELRVILLRSCLGVQTVGLTYFGNIIHSTTEEDANDSSDPGFEMDYVDPRHTPEYERQFIQTTVVRLNRETRSITLPLLYRKLQMKCGAASILGFLKWLPEHLRCLIKHIVLDKRREGSEHYAPARASSAGCVYAYLIKAMDLDVLTLMPKMVDPTGHIFSMLVLEGHLPEVRLCYSQGDVPDDTHMKRLGLISQIYADHDQELTFAFPTSSEEFMSISEVRVARFLEVYRSMYPFAISLSLQTDMAVVVIKAQLEVAEARIESVINGHDTGPNCLTAHCGPGTPTLEGTLTLLQDLVQCYHEGREKTKRTRARHRRYQRKMLLRAKAELAFLDPIEEEVKKVAARAQIFHHGVRARMRSRRILRKCQHAHHI